jgi:formate-dependent nitrite reductase cytochrome c552 subunit
MNNTAARHTRRANKCGLCKVGYEEEEKVEHPEWFPWVEGATVYGLRGVGFIAKYKRRESQD